MGTTESWTTTLYTFLRISDKKKIRIVIKITRHTW